MRPARLVPLLLLGLLAGTGAATAAVPAEAEPWLRPFPLDSAAAAEAFAEEVAAEPVPPGWPSVPWVGSPTGDWLCPSAGCKAYEEARACTPGPAACDPSDLACTTCPLAPRWAVGLAERCNEAGALGCPASLASDIFVTLNALITMEMQAFLHGTVVVQVLVSHVIHAKHGTESLVLGEAARLQEDPLAWDAEEAYGRANGYAHDHAVQGVELGRAARAFQAALFEA